MSLIEDVLRHCGLMEAIPQRKGWQPIRCVFHDDTTASASVNLDLGAYRCHGCPTKGDAVALVMIAEDLPDRVSAERFLTDELGVSHSEIRAAPRRGRAVPRGSKRLPDAGKTVPFRRR